MNRSNSVSSITLGAALLGGVAMSINALAADACHEQWIKSSAYKTCHKLMSVEGPKGVCTLTVSCDEADGVPGDDESSIWTLDSVPKLTNSNGHLTGGVVPQAAAPAPKVLLDQ
ncbi:hypothetical protein N7650_08200 [Pseudomonas sp. GD04058]|uniref:hypothetical protein n=1 Tax=Pseudomonas sp. GD04058 TaxID=2975429 RepID=UPI00244744C1|nr:hypothetical protein [Pseudomonas sp. GD04058]MDG9882812.1 hypothetical protein [Pseudomonas sp. GD04058]